MEVYVDELISSSLVIAFNETGEDPRCKIHDLVHDFCRVKSRKEKLFYFISSSAPLSSSSNLMSRGMTIHYDHHFPHSDENLVLLSADKENPYVKHLIFFKVYMDAVEYGKHYHLSYNYHLKHLKLLKSYSDTNYSHLD
ncbi:hypothetical protein RND71_008173 [Anisodus tanguticus]|uniref:Uncharacterized protein n=1 Tax=Anisodus tanguticus TaxID=243964 RepID=A0AAE1VTK6_9SOLA|nr:hypothetical protein RND71_008173 [Anisodus tanguticus]